jgi:type VI secretion system secreted protein Hcp
MSEILLDISDPKIPGDSTIKGFEGQTNILSLSFGSTAAAEFNSSSSGGTFGGSNVQEILITKYVDASTPKLFALCANGGHIKKCKITMLRSGRMGFTPYLIYELDDTLITSMDISASDERPIESISLNFTKININYIQLDEAGNRKDNVPATFDLKTNVRS